METVEVLIRIPKDKYDEVMDMKGILQDKPDLFRYSVAVANGTVLPKGHGKLIDSNVLWDAFQDLGQDFQEAFDFAEANAVIEADKDGE